MDAQDAGRVLQHRRSDATGPDGAGGHTLEVVRSPYAIGDVPAPA